LGGPVAPLAPPVPASLQLNIEIIKAIHIG